MRHKGYNDSNGLSDRHDNNNLGLALLRKIHIKIDISTEGFTDWLPAVLPVNKELRLKMLIN